MKAIVQEQQLWSYTSLSCVQCQVSALISLPTLFILYLRLAATSARSWWGYSLPYLFWSYCYERVWAKMKQTVMILKTFIVTVIAKKVLRVILMTGMLSVWLLINYNLSMKIIRFPISPLPPSFFFPLIVSVPFAPQLVESFETEQPISKAWVCSDKLRTSQIC